MTLQDIKVILDGYNLSLAQGTGVKNYGLTLLDSLQKLKAHTSILYSVHTKKSQNQDLNEILFFDSFYTQWKSQSNPSKKSIAKFLFSPSLLTRTRQATTIYQQGKSRIVILESDQKTRNILEKATLYNSAFCYSFSYLMMKSFKSELTIKLPSSLDIFHATYPIPLSVKNTKKITTIHDLIPLRLPYTTLDEKKLYYNTIQKVLETSDLIVAVSEHTKKDILSIFNYDPQKIVVTYQPVPLQSSSWDNHQVANILQSYGLKQQEYCLFVGAIEPKKNLSRLLDAYQMLSSPLPLVIVGKKAWLYEEIFKKAKRLKNTVIFLDYVSNYELQFLYQGAYCFLFPSLYEGFGLPPLEAMNFGCPVITSQESSLPEVCGDSALYVNPYDIHDMAEKIQKVLQYPTIREKLTLNIPNQLEKFSIDNYLVRLLEAYQQIL